MSEIIRLNNLKRKLEYVREKHKNDKVDMLKRIYLLCVTTLLTALMILK